MYNITETFHRRSSFYFLHLSTAFSPILIEVYIYMYVYLSLHGKLPYFPVNLLGNLLLSPSSVSVKRRDVEGKRGKGRRVFRPTPWRSLSPGEGEIMAAAAPAAIPKVGRALGSSYFLLCSSLLIFAICFIFYHPSLVNFVLSFFFLYTSLIALATDRLLGAILPRPSHAFPRPLPQFDPLPFSLPPKKRQRPPSPLFEVVFRFSPQCVASALVVGEFNNLSSD